MPSILVGIAAGASHRAAPRPSLRRGGVDGKTPPGGACVGIAGGVDCPHLEDEGAVGQRGQGVDPLLRVFLSKRFAKAMDDHARTEFPMLRDRRDHIQAELSGR
jgi:hypothetical protein